MVLFNVIMSNGISYSFPKNLLNGVNIYIYIYIYIYI